MGQWSNLADASAVEFTRNPEGLASALAKLAGDKTPMEHCRVTEAMFIVSPKVGLRGGADSLFSTHPPIPERIRRLMALRCFTSFLRKEVKQEKRTNAVCVSSRLLTALTSFFPQKKK